MKVTLFILGIVLSVSIGLFVLGKNPVEMLGAPSQSLTYEGTLIPLSDSLYDLGTSSQAWRDIYVDEICLTGDSCETSWPAGGSGGGAGLFQYTSATDTISPIAASTSNTARLSVSSFHATSTATSSTFHNASTTGVTATNFWGALVGNADTATALAANGANCSSGNAPLGVDASGAVESCFDVWTEAENTSAAYLNSASIDTYSELNTIVADVTLTHNGLFDTSAELRGILTDEVGTGAAYFVGGALGTPASGTLTNATGLPISTGVSGLGAGVATWLGTPSSANLITAVTDETGSGSLVFASSPTLTGTPVLPSTFTIGANSFVRSGAHGLTLTTTGTTNVTLPTSGTLATLTSAMTGTFDGNNFGGGAIGQGDILYGSAAGTIAELAKDANATRYLSNQGTSNNPSWNQVNLTNGVTGTLPAGNGGTGITSLGSGVTTFLGTPSTANFFSMVTGETGSGAVVGGTSPTISSPTLTSFFGTPCTGNEFLQDISDTGAFTCTEAAGGGGSGTLSTTTEKIGGGAASTVSYVTDEFMLGGSASSSAEFLFDYTGSQFFINSSTTISSTTILSADASETVIIGEGDNQGDDFWVVGEGIANVFATAGDWIVNGIGSVAEMVLNLNLTVAGDIRIEDGTGASVLKAEQSLISFTLASTSDAFLNAGSVPIAKHVTKARDITQYRCWVEGGTSVVINMTDGTNDTETITCTSSVASDTNVATNSTFTANEKWYAELGTVTGSVNYVTFEALGYVE